MGVVERSFSLYLPVFGIFRLPHGQPPERHRHNAPTIHLRNDDARFAGAVCVPLFTDSDLAKRWFEDNPEPGHTSHWLQFNAAFELKGYLERVAGVSHVAIDPHKDKLRPDWIFPIPDFIDCLRQWAAQN